MMLFLIRSPCTTSGYECLPAKGSTSSRSTPVRFTFGVGGGDDITGYCYRRNWPPAGVPDSAASAPQGSVDSREWQLPQHVCFFPHAPLRLHFVIFLSPKRLIVHCLPLNHSSPEKKKKIVACVIIGGGLQARPDPQPPVPDPWDHKYGGSFHWGTKASKEILICSDLSLALGLATPSFGKGLPIRTFPHYTVGGALTGSMLQMWLLRLREITLPRVWNGVW